MSDVIWEQVEQFKNLEMGKLARLVRPHTDLHDKYGPDYDEEQDGPAIIPRAEYVGVVTELNPRGEVRLQGHYSSFLADATFGEWFWEIYKEAASE